MRTEARSNQTLSRPGPAMTRGLAVLGLLALAAGALLASGPEGRGEVDAQGYVFLR